jgi:hypothetical protein
MSITSLQSRALLAVLTIRKWDARVSDKRVNQSVASSFNTNQGVGNYSKKLLPGEKQLANINALAATIRQKFYKATLPWGIDGTFILPSALYTSFTETFNEDRRAWEQLVDDFVDAYPSLQQRAKEKLGDLYNPNEYPSPQMIRKRFHMEVNFMEVPTGDFRCSLTDDEIDFIRRDVQRKTKEAEELAMREVWQRLFDRVEHIANKLSDPEAIFRDSMLENAQEIVDLLPKLNIANDEKLEQLRNEVQKRLLNTSPKELRTNPVLRKAKAKEASAIVSAMSAFMS